MRILPPLLLSVFVLLCCCLGPVRGQSGPDRFGRMDRDGDGKISRDEWRGPDRFFDRIDTDGDGFLSPEEMTAMRNRRGGAGRRGNRRGSAGMLTQRMDANHDGKVSKEEWEAFFTKADRNGDNLLQPEELAAAMSGSPLRDPAPKLGDPAPAVKATAAKDGRVVDLSKPRRTTVLVFGSWT